MKVKENEIGRFGHFIIFFLNCTWGIIQSFIGLIIFLVFINKPHFWYECCIVTVSASFKSLKIKGGLSLGIFIFTSDYIEKEQIKKSSLVKHEYGHALQSSLLGPLFLPIVGFPSLIWAGCFAGWRKKHKKDYYSFYTESWADKMAKRSKS